MWKVGSRVHCRRPVCWRWMGGPNSASNTHNGAQKRIFSNAGDACSSVGKTAKSISWMSAQVTIHGEHAAQEWASKLSPAARKEVTELMRGGGGEAAAATVTVPEPTEQELKLVALQNGIPFVGFGFMDNSILILAGDAIDTSLGVTLGISTMCAAAIGNIVSDVAGIGLGTIIEDWCAKLGLPVAQISAAQRQLRSVRFANQFGCAVGIVVGCIIGMFPLFLIDHNKIHRLKQEAHMNSIFSDVVEKAKELVGAEITNLYVIVDSKDSKTPTDLSKAAPTTTEDDDDEEKQQYFYSMHGHPIHIPVGRGIITRAAMNGTIENVKDARQDAVVAHEEWKKAFPHVDIKSMVCVPVFDSRGQVIAILQAMNKVNHGITRRDSHYSTAHATFSKTDESILKVLASHIAVSLQNMYEADVELSLRETIEILKTQGLAGLEERQILTLPANSTQRKATERLMGVVASER